MAESAPRETDFAAAFVGLVVPDEERYRTVAFSRAGNMAQINTIKSLIDAGVHVNAVFSFLPIPSFPGSRRIYVRKQRATLFPGCPVVLLPFLNVLPFKQIHLGLRVFFALLIWSWKSRRTKRVILLYNLSRPPAIFAYLAARLTGAKITALLYDLGVPPLPLDHMLWYRIDDVFARYLVPRLDGRVVITERIVDDYAPGKHFLHVDGGVAEEKISDWPPLEPRDEFVLAFAGMLSSLNGVEVLLDAFALLKDPTYRLEIAGDGKLEEKVRAAAEVDKRICYHGRLTHDRVLEMYRRSDVLLNIRLTSQIGPSYLFPSKLLEYLAMGRSVITTPVAHAEREYGQFCFLLREETPQAVADLIEKVRHYDWATRVKMAEAARDYIRTKKTWSNQGKRILRYLQDYVVAG